MKKKLGQSIFISLILSSISFSMMMPLASAYSFYLYDFRTDRDSYHMSGHIVINATWDLYFDPVFEEMFVQIQIYDCANDLIWKSSQYNESRSYNESWVIDIANLSHNINEKSIFHVKFFQHWVHKISLESMNVFIREKKITIHEDELECQLDNFKEILTINEIFDVEARFYDLINDIYIINQEIFFEMIANELKLYEYNYTTNSMGEIEFSIDVFSQMNLGNNTLRFSIINSQLYNNTVFEYTVFVGSSAVTGEPLDGNLFVLISFACVISGVLGIFLYIKKKSANL